MGNQYPGEKWERTDPGPAGIDASKLRETGQWLQAEADGAPYRVVAVREGRLVAEWNQGIEPDERRGMASATKSLFSCMLGIAVEERRIGSLDDPVVGYYPEMMEVPEGRGPKPGRHAKPVDRGITFRQLICNTSGYMKPGETPGDQFHYQTFGMNILAHAVARTYGRYDSSEPEDSPGIGSLIEEKIRDPIGGSWTHEYGNFDLPEEAKLGVFGYFHRACASALDMARMGLLWLREGRWNGRQVVPADYMRRAVQVAPDVKEHCPREQWTYGHGFWTNQFGLLWPSLPRDAFAARGAGNVYIHVIPDLELVVAQGPGVHREQEVPEHKNVVVRIAAACR